MGPDDRRTPARRSPAPLPGSGRGALGRREVPRIVTGRRAVRRSLRQARWVPIPPPGLRPGRQGLSAVSPRDRAREGRRAVHLLLPLLPSVNHLHFRSWPCGPGRSGPGSGARTVDGACRRPSPSASPSRYPRDRAKTRVRSGNSHKGAAECS